MTKHRCPGLTSNKYVAKFDLNVNEVINLPMT